MLSKGIERGSQKEIIAKKINMEYAGWKKSKVF
jgi:hypothetical protein